MIRKIHEPISKFSQAVFRQMNDDDVQVMPLSSVNKKRTSHKKQASVGICKPGAAVRAQRTTSVSIQASLKVLIPKLSYKSTLRIIVNKVNFH